MITATCISCGKETAFPEPSALPAECPGCFKAWPEHVHLTTDSPTPKGSAQGLTLTYLPHDISIEIPAADSVLIGRSHHGAELLDTIRNQHGEPLISRLHCEIAFRNGQFLLSDRNSTHGVFLGEHKTPCLNTPIPDGETVFLGRERFLARIHYAEPDPIPEPRPPKPSGPYRCNEMGCQHISETLSSACPACGAMGTLREM